MGHTRYSRFLALSAAGLVAAGAGAVVTAQTGLNFSAGELAASAEVTDLTAASSTIQAGHGLFGSSDTPVAVVTLQDVAMGSVCLRMRSVDVPVIGTVTVTAVLPEHATIHAEGLTIDAPALSGPMALDGLNIGSGVAPQTERTGRDGLGLSSQGLSAGHLDVDLAGLHAERLTSSSIELRAERGEARC